MTAPDKAWLKQTSGWGSLERGVYQNTPSAGGVPYLASTPARERAEELLKLVAAQLEALEAFGISGGSIPESKALLAEIKGAGRVASSCDNET